MDGTPVYHSTPCTHIDTYCQLGIVNPVISIVMGDGGKQKTPEETDANMWTPCKTLLLRSLSSGSKWGTWNYSAAMLTISNTVPT